MHTTEHDRPPIYGLLAEFETPEALYDAASRTRDAGYTRYDAYSPFPYEPLEEVVPKRGPYLPLLVLIGGLSGAALGFALQYYTAAEYYPLNVGGRPLLSWPLFLPITFEVGVLLAAFTAVFGMLALNGLPMPYHPVFNVERFSAASNDRFFLAIEARDPKFESVDSMHFLEGLGAVHVSQIPH